MALTSCCCGCSLRRGSLFIGWASLIFQTLSLFLFIGALVLVEEEAPDTVKTLTLDSDVTTLPFLKEEEEDLPKLEVFNDARLLKPAIKIEFISLDDEEEEISKEDTEDADFKIFSSIDDIFKNHMLFGLNMLLNDMHDDAFHDGLNINSRGKRNVDDGDVVDTKYEAPVYIAGIVISAVQMITSLLLIGGVRVGNKHCFLPWFTTTIMMIILDTVHVIYCLLVVSGSEVDTLLDVIFIGVYMYMLAIVYSHYKELQELKNKETLDIYKEHCERPWESATISILSVPEKKIEKH